MERKKWKTLEKLENYTAEVDNEKKALTILESLDNFGIARLTLNRSVKWRNEKFILWELVQVSNVMHLAVWFHYSHTTVLLSIAASQITVADVQALMNF